jgi:hypothetical protein
MHGRQAADMTAGQMWPPRSESGYPGQARGTRRLAVGRARGRSGGGDPGGRTEVASDSEVAVVDWGLGKSESKTESEAESM